ncbi:hypothetical protein Dimus_015966, partial [Dionaea muscipula]
MAGRTRGSFQRRVRDAGDVGCDPRSPDGFLVFGRGLPSPGPPQYRRAPLSLGIWPILHQRSPSLMMSSSPNLDAMSSSEGGDSSSKVVLSSEVEEHSDLDVDKLDLSSSLLLSLIPEEIVKLEGSISAAVSSSPTPSPTTAVLLRQSAIAVGGHEDGRSLLARCDSVSALSGGVYRSKPLSLVLVDGEDGGVLGLPMMGDGHEGVTDVLCPTASVSPVSPSSLLFDVDGAPVYAKPVSAVGVVIDGGDSLSAVGWAKDELRNMDVQTVKQNICLLTEPQLVGSNLLVANGPLCVGHIGYGLVSEEGWVSPVAREALRSQPADGLRQSPSPPMEPMIGAEGGGGQDN